MYAFSRALNILSRGTQLEATGAKIFELDYVNEGTIAKAAEAYGPESLDCLINCAGSFGHQ
jgi:hypothetical protein